MKFDDLLKHTGGFGRYQWLLCAILFYGVMTCSFHNLSIVFIAAVPEHWCSVPEIGNITTDMLRNFSIPKDIKDGDEVYSQCEMYDRNYSAVSSIPDLLALESNITTNGSVSNPARVPCRSGWTYDKSVYTNTIVSQWNLVCDRKAWVTVAKTVYLAGKMLGGLVIGFVGDRWGRRNALLASFVGMMLMTIAEAFAPEEISFIAFRFIVAIFSMEFYNGIYIMSLEFVGPQWRVLVGFLVALIWDAGHIALAGTAFAIRNWFWLQIVVAIIFFPCCIYFCLVPESPRWLFLAGKSEEAMKIVRKIARVNKKDIPEKLEIEIEEDNVKTSPLDVVRTPRLRIRSLVLFLIWNTDSLVYYGLNLNTHRMGGDNNHLNFFLTGIVEVPANIVAGFVCKRLGCKWPQIISIMGAGVALLLIIPVPEDMVALRLSMALIGKALITASFNISYLYTSEIYPTVVRNQGLSICSMMARVGGTLAPMAGDLGDYTGFKPLPFIIFGIFSIVSGLAGLLLPDMKNCNMPETIEDAENIGRKRTSNGDLKRSDKEKDDDQEMSEFLHHDDEKQNGRNGAVDPMIT